MTTFRYTITAEDAGDEIQHFLRFKQASAARSLSPSSICRRAYCETDSTPAPLTCCGREIFWRSTCRSR